MMKTLFLHPPSFDGFDGGAGSRYQAKREIRSFWYPTWLAQPAALVPDSKLVDAPPARLKLDDVLPLAGDYELAVLHTSTPSFASDAKVAEALKDRNPQLKIGMIGAMVAVEPEDSLKASAAIDFVAREEFDFTVKEVAEGRPYDTIDGISFRNANGVIVNNRERAVLEDMDRLPFVTEVYKRDLRVEDYFIGFACAASPTSSTKFALQRAISHRSKSSSSMTTPSPTTVRAPRRSPANSASSV